MDEFHKCSERKWLQKSTCFVIHLYGFLEQAKLTYVYRNQIIGCFWEWDTDWEGAWEALLNERDALYLDMHS